MEVNKIIPIVKLRKFPKLEEYNEELGVNVYNKFFIRLRGEYYTPLTALMLSTSSLKFGKLASIIKKQYKSYVRWKLHNLISDVECLGNSTLSIPCEYHKFLLGIKYNKILDVLEKYSWECNGVRRISCSCDADCRIQRVIDFMGNLHLGNTVLLHSNLKGTSLVVPVDVTVLEHLNKRSYTTVSSDPKKTLFTFVFHRVGDKVYTATHDGTPLGELVYQVNKMQDRVCCELSISEFSEHPVKKELLEKYKANPLLSHLSEPIMYSYSYSPEKRELYFIIPAFNTGVPQQNMTKFEFMWWLEAKYNGDFIKVTARLDGVCYKILDSGLWGGVVKYNGEEQIITPDFIQHPLIGKC